MATVNIGNLTFTHRGDYASGTAYVKNDVVYYATNGNAYIAKQATTGNAPTNGTYWSQFAAGSGGIWNAGLSLGSAGQIVKVNSGASALEFGDAPSGVVKKIEEYTNNTRASLSASTSKVNMFSGTFTTTTASSKILIQILIPTFGTEAGSINMGISWNGTDYNGRHHYSYSASNDTYMQVGQGIFDNSSTPGSHSWAVYYDSNSSSSKPHSVVNPNNNDDGRIVQDVTSIIFTEFKN